MRGRKPKPVELHLLDGTYRRDRHGSAPAQSTLFASPAAEHPAPEPPKHLRGTSLKLWTETVAILKRLGILDAADQGILALYCEARAEVSWADYRISRDGRLVPGASGNLRAHPAVAIKHAAALRCAKFAAELGLTPTARTRLRLAVTPDDPDPEESDLD